MNIIDKWVNPYYLQDRVVTDIRESIFAKPEIKYAVLDNFFNEEMLDQLIHHHKFLNFSEENDRRSPEDGKWLPYDGAVVFAKKGEHFGSELFYDKEWHEYCCYITGVKLDCPAGTEVKLRYHRPNADGFWIHTDSTIRSLVAICYFNKEWRAADGGILQLWRVDEADAQGVFTIDTPTGRLDFLNNHKRIRTRTPGGGFPDKKAHDLVLVDTIVPAYNRLFICNLQHHLAYHSVTPSSGKIRLGFVQWLYDKRTRNER